MLGGDLVRVRYVVLRLSAFVAMRKMPLTGKDENLRTLSHEKSRALSCPHQLCTTKELRLPQADSTGLTALLQTY